MTITSEHIRVILLISLINVEVKRELIPYLIQYDNRKGYPILRRLFTVVSRNLNKNRSVCVRLRVYRVGTFTLINQWLMKYVPKSSYKKEPL